ncbi:hypothetical protein HDE78_003072 [Rhodanobacter sp. K2T2]|uniref:hypothetical protein n=1 Tax=Rhodanobacter sp. K2T2 TaxID=2723085 RepID=UPI0015C6F083|nr:hypothetical protein [Rhodanobacter sp. K2T2]NYE30104.1 hypothetical protein [Rhodanobacter sp. K2T2]
MSSLTNAEYFGWIGHLPNITLAPSSVPAHPQLDCKPTGPGFLARSRNIDYGWCKTKRFGAFSDPLDVNFI